MDNVLKVPAFGFSGYNPKAVVKDSFPVKVNALSKNKRKMFCELASASKDYIPGSDKYQLDVNWEKNPTSRNYKFGKDARMTIADEITKKSEQKEKSSPGPTAYNEYDTWKNKISQKTLGNYKYQDERISFVKER